MFFVCREREMYIYIYIYIHIYNYSIIVNMAEPSGPASVPAKAPAEDDPR